VGRGSTFALSALSRRGLRENRRTVLLSRMQRAIAPGRAAASPPSWPARSCMHYGHASTCLSTPQARYAGEGGIAAAAALTSALPPRWAEGKGGARAKSAPLRLNRQAAWHKRAAAGCNHRERDQPSSCLCYQRHWRDDMPRDASLNEAPPLRRRTRAALGDGTVTGVVPRELFRLLFRALLSMFWLVLAGVVTWPRLAGSQVACVALLYAAGRFLYRLMVSFFRSDEISRNGRQPACCCHGFSQLLPYQATCSSDSSSGEQ